MHDDDVNDRDGNFSLIWHPEDFIDADKESRVEDDPWLLFPGDSELKDANNANAADVPDFSELKFIDCESDGFVDGDEDEFEEVEDIYDNIDDLDEPEPFAQYDRGLYEPLHVPGDSVSNISHSLRINEFVASVLDATDTQQSQITELLENFSLARLRSWLPWMREKEWTGHSLLLFLDFRLNHWEENPRVVGIHILGF